MNKLKYALPSIVFTIIVLHNSLDQASRAFVATIPRNADVQIIDWYGDDTARFSYTGPPPSAFPTAVIDLPAHTENIKDISGHIIGTKNVPSQKATLRTPANWHVVEAALSHPLSAAIETACVDGQYRGGQTLKEANELRQNPFLSIAGSMALEKGLSTAADNHGTAQLIIPKNMDK